MDLLEHGQLRIVVLPGGEQRRAMWRVANRCWHFHRAPAGLVTLEQIKEWWPLRKAAAR